MTGEEERGEARPHVEANDRKDLVTQYSHSRRRFAGPEGLRACCLERSMVVDRIPFVKTGIPAPINYPINTKKGLLFGGSLVGMLYDESWIGKFLSVLGIIKGSF